MITANDLNKIKNSMHSKMDLRENPDKYINGNKYQILICGGTGCMSSASKEIENEFKRIIEEKNLNDDIKLVFTGCFGLCEKGPVVVIYPEKTFYSHVKIKDVSSIINDHIISKKIVTRLLVKDTNTKELIEKFDNLPFYAKQERIVLRNCGNIDPSDINEYIYNDGYFALAKALTKMTPIDVINEVKNSNLRGRGGGGFPTGNKWEFARLGKNSPKNVICNADEGDPGAFMDRSILEGDPHAIIEAMAICGYAIGANNGYIYIRAEYPVAVDRLEVAIKQAKELGLIGKNILGTGFDFDLEIRLGAGAFVCGEETALIASIEGNRGMPKNKPPFPAVEGLWKKSTNVNNVETFANIPSIILKGSKWFKSIGTKSSSGTKVFALGGKIVNTGLIEVPMGTTLREVIFDIGGGIPNKKKFKAVQTGGPSGGCIVESDLDTPIDFDNLVKLGSMMGSGGMIVMDEDNCMVDVARFYMDFIVDESCGKCTPCREGTKRMLEIINKITEGKGTLEDIEKLESLGEMIRTTSLCGLGQTAPNPVISTLKHFKSEYIEHISNKVCPSGVCTKLISFFITDKCIGCGKCAKDCPVDVITGTPKQIHVIDQENCIKCGNCKTVCPVLAITSKPQGGIDHA